MAMTGKIGPRAEVRVDGKGDHDLISVEFNKSKPKSPVVKIGDTEVSSYTAAAATAVSWSGEVVSRPDGTFAINWDDILDNDLVIPMVMSTSGRKERMTNATVDELGTSYNVEDGRLARSISGQAGKHSVE